MTRLPIVLVPLVVLGCCGSEALGAFAPAVSQPSGKSPSPPEFPDASADQDGSQEQGVKALHHEVSGGEWTVRVTRLFPSRERTGPQPHVPRVTTQYWLRRTGERDEVLAYEMRGTYWKSVLAVLDNGTLLLGSSTNLTWVPRGAPPRDEPLRLGGERAHILRAWPDGAVVQPYDGLNEASDVFFVPIRGDALDFSKKLQLTDDKSVWWRSQQFARSEHELVWLSNPERRRDSESICLYDLRTHEKQVFPFRERWVELKEFKEHIAVIRQDNSFVVFDTVRGERLGVSRSADALAEREGFRYYIFVDKVVCGPRDFECTRFRIVSVDLTSINHATQVLDEVLMYGGSTKPRVVEGGIEVFNGKKVLLVPWAKRKGTGSP